MNPLLKISKSRSQDQDQSNESIPNLLIAVHIVHAVVHINLHPVVAIEEPEQAAKNYDNSVQSLVKQWNSSTGTPGIHIRNENMCLKSTVHQFYILSDARYWSAETYSPSCLTNSVSLVISLYRTVSLECSLNSSSFELDGIGIWKSRRIRYNSIF